MCTVCAALSIVAGGHLLGLDKVQESEYGGHDGEDDHDARDGDTRDDAGVVLLRGSGRVGKRQAAGSGGD